MAFIASFNSCKEDEFKLPEETINAIRVKNGAVVEDTLIKDSYQLRAGTSVHDNILIGTSIDNLESLYDNYKLKPYTKYFWKIVVTDGSNSAETDILKFYCVPKFPVEVKNEDEDDWSATVKWKKYEQFGDMRITLTPDSECDYDKTPIAVSKGESLCRISAGPLNNQKYAIYHQWWDDSKRQYYKPVIYDFTVNADCEFDDTVITAQSTAKGIFLNKSVAVADKQYNVYKIGKIGNRVWMLEDLRGTLDLSGYDDYNIFDFRHRQWWAPGTGCATVKNNYGFKSVVYAISMALFCEEFNELIPEGFHLATDDDWNDMEANYGLYRNTKERHLLNVSNLRSYFPDYNLVTKYGPTELRDYRYSEDTTIFKGKDLDLLTKLISKEEWKSAYTGETIAGAGVFNARPFGLYKAYIEENYVTIGDEFNTKNFEEGGIAKSEVAVYLTADTEPILRVLWSGNKGIGRAEYNYDYWGNEIKNSNIWSSEYVQIRCVKD